MFLRTVRRVASVFGFVHEVEANMQKGAIRLRTFLLVVIPARIWQPLSLNLVASAELDEIEHLGMVDVEPLVCQRFLVFEKQLVRQIAAVARSEQRFETQVEMFASVAVFALPLLVIVTDLR